MFKSAFVALLGSSNVGKSTLLNYIIGRKIAIVTRKPQTTRHRIIGVHTEKDFQMVFFDTPGIHTPRNKLGEHMVKIARSTAKDVDVILFMVDAKVGVRERDQKILSTLPKEVPVFILINKTDIVNEERIREVEESVKQYEFDTFRVSALTGAGVRELMDALENFLQEGPMFYPEDMITDQSNQVIMAELIREKALHHIGQEIPHGIGVEIEHFAKEADRELYNIDAVIYCEKESHKGIIIGAGGRMIKKIASDARVDMEQMLGTKVFLQVWVKVKTDWRNKPSMLKTLGYEEQ